MFMVTLVNKVTDRGGSRISGKGALWVFALLILSYFFLNIPCKWDNLVSLRPNYSIYIRGLKTGGW